MTRKQWIETAMEIDEDGSDFICHAAQNVAPYEETENLKSRLRDALTPEAFGGCALNDTDPIPGPEGEIVRLLGKAYRDPKVLLCLFFAAMSAEERGEWGL